MKIIVPEIIADASLTSSNVTEADHPVWLVGTTYNLADRVIVLSTHRIYESLIGSNIGNDPTLEDPENPTNWLDVSATNRWKAFDEIIADQVVNASTIEYEFDTTGIINSVALFGLDAETAQVIATSAVDGEVYNETVALTDNSAINNWYAYFFEPIVRKSRHVFVDLPQYLDTTIDVVIGVSSGDAYVGQIVIGRLRGIGGTEFGTTVGIRDYSTKENNIFGDPIIVERRYSDVVDYDVAVRSTGIDALRTLLVGFRSSPVVWIGDDSADYGVLVYGYYKDFDVVLSSPSISRASIQVEGLV